MKKKSTNVPKPKITVSLGFTLLLNSVTHEYIRPEIRIQDIDTSEDIKVQVKHAIESSKIAWDEIIKTIIKRVSELKT
mgnify:CR=1 FL=1